MDWNIVLQAVILIIGFVLLVKGSDVFVSGAAGIAKKFGVSDLIIGLTVVAMGTSAPEAAVSISSSLKGVADVSIGNILGSNILNILIVLGISAFIVALPVGKSTYRLEMPFLLLISVLFFALGLDYEMSRFDGIILWAFFIVYMIYVIASAIRHPESADVDEVASMKLWKALLFTVLGLAMVVFGSEFAVKSASEIATTFGMSERFIGLTIVALGTSLPEIFTSTTAARKGNVDMAIGNIIGSNIFNCLFVVGTSSLLMPIPYDAAFKFDSLVVISVTVLLWLFSLGRKHKIGRFKGFLFLATYAAYFVYVAFIL